MSVPKYEESREDLKECFVHGEYTGEKCEVCEAIKRTY